MGIEITTIMKDDVKDTKLVICYAHVLACVFHFPDFVFRVLMDQ